MTDRTPADRGVVAARPELGGGAATPSFRLPEDATSGLPGRLGSLRIGSATFVWASRTFVMGILNVTPDSFSGDGLLGASAAEPDNDPVATAVAIGRRMVDEGADLLDVGGESTRPGHVVVGDGEEIARVVPVIRALRTAMPDVPLSIDTTKVEVAAAALAAGADLVNDVWGVRPDDDLLGLAADRGAPIVLMHNRAEARYANLMAEVIADLEHAIERAVGKGIAWESIIIDPGFGFGKTPVHNLVLLRELASLRVLGRPVLLGTSRKSTLGKVLDLPPDQRIEATLATTALGIAAGVDVVRVHDVRPNVRTARMADAILRGDQTDDGEAAAPGREAAP
jgi:dihydropteroate synthase